MLAFTCLEDKASAIEFLNEFRDDLGGRPLEIAMASEEGYALVAEVIRKLGAAS